MNDLKGLADVVDHLVYEVIGLLLPGSIILLVSVAVVLPEQWSGALGFAGLHPWIAVGAAYTAGYLLQSLSRPICNLTSWALTTVPRLSVWFLRRVSQGAHGWLKEKTSSLGRWLIGGDTPPANTSDDARAVLEAVAAGYWERRLGLASGLSLGRRDVIDLSYSAIGDERKRLLRFRSANSLCRGLAAIAALGLGGVVAGLLGPLPINMNTVLAVVALIIIFWGFMSRADMYDSLWNEILVPQFLALATAKTSTASVSRSAAVAQPGLEE